MSSFVSRINSITGKQEWILQNDDYDYQQECARSAYADMLHDTERNKKYDLALQQAIALLKSRRKTVHVLDIGTGTGLLSMMAVRAGADTVTACEAFAPMARCAAEVMTQNKLKDRINLIPKRSTELTVGKNGDMKTKANILVTEVFDTELIGEGALGTFRHAHQHLLEPNCLVVPTAATVYAQIVQSDLVSRWHHLMPWEVKGHGTISPPDAMGRCTGAASLHDLQLDQIDERNFQAVGAPVDCFKFDFSKEDSLQLSEHSVNKVFSKITGLCHAVFMWWELQMDPEGKISLSCAPRWAHQSPVKEMQWRDHWMQAIYHLQHPVPVNSGDLLYLHSYLDEYSLWFDVAKQPQCEPTVGPCCNCGLHIAYSRSRIGMLNDPVRRSCYEKCLKKTITDNSRCFCLSDGSLLPLVVSKMGPSKVYTQEPSIICRRITECFVNSNKLENTIEILNKSLNTLTLDELGGKQINVLVSEPHFTSSLLPWHNLYFWYARTALASLLAPSAIIMPHSATLWIIGVQLEHLWKIRAPVGTCEGFDLQPFDALIMQACELSDAVVEPQPLWEYPGIALTNPIQVLHFDFTRPIDLEHNKTSQGSAHFTHNGNCNGVAIWMDFHISETETVTTGLITKPEPGAKLDWDVYSRQGVHLFKKPQDIRIKSDKLEYTTIFNPSSGEIDFEFFFVGTSTQTHNCKEEIKNGR